MTMPMIEAILHLFKMQIKHLFVNSIEFNQPLFGIALKGFDAIDMTFSTSKFIVTMIYS